MGEQEPDKDPRQQRQEIALALQRLMSHEPSGAWRGCERIHVQVARLLSDVVGVQLALLELSNGPQPTSQAVVIEKMQCQAQDLALSLLNRTSQI